RHIDRDQALRTFKEKLETMTMLTSFKPEERDLLEYMNMYGYDYNSLMKAIYVNRVQRTDYVEIDAVSEIPDLSAYMVNNLFPEFLRYYRRVRSTRSEESLDTLKSLMDRKKQDLDAKNDQLRSQGILDVGEENTSKLETIMNLETTLTQEQGKQTQRQYDLEKVNKRLVALGGAPATTGKNAKTTPTGNNDELVILRNAMNDAYKAYISSGSSDPALKKKYE